MKAVQARKKICFPLQGFYETQAYASLQDKIFCVGTAFFRAFLAALFIYVSL